MQLTGQNLPRLISFSQAYENLLGIFKRAHAELGNQVVQPRLFPVGLAVGGLEDDERFEVRCAGWAVTVRFRGVMSAEGLPEGRVDFHEKTIAGVGSLLDSVTFNAAGLSGIVSNARQHQVLFSEWLPAMVLAVAEKLLRRRAEMAAPVP
jgi:hypothetical protein